MKASFGDKKKNDKNSRHEIYKGGFERMVKERKDKLPELEGAINEVLEDYDGSTICIIRIKEDENGDTEGHQLFIGGVSKLETQLSLGIALNKASDQIRDQLIETVKDDPRAMRSVLSAMIDELGDVLGKDK